STLTIVGLTPFTTYYLRAGAFNYNDVLNFANVLSTQTLPGAAPGAPTITAVHLTSMTVTYATVGNSMGYELDASTMSTFAPVTTSSTTTDHTLGTLAFNVGTLDPNTTYYVRIGALYNGATNYSLSNPSTSTLADAPQNVLIYEVDSTSVTLNWTTFTAGPGANTSEGYELDASSTNFNGTGTVYFSSNTTPSVSTLTIVGLTPFTTYYLRAGAFNYNDVLNFANVLSTQTLPGASPGAPTITAVYLTSMTVTYATVGNSMGYELDASTMSTFAPVTTSSNTSDNTLGTLAFNVGTLDPNTTYYVRIGAL